MADDHPTYDLLFRGATVVRPDRSSQPRRDIGVRDGRFTAVAERLDPTEAARVVDAEGLLAFPGVVDTHQHWGIYNPLEQDAASESRACAQGGVTTGITYIRTGQYYLNKAGPYAEFLPEAVALARGNAYVDYAFHLAPMEQRHIDEIPSLISDHGITSFKIFMFYGSHGLHGRSADQSKFLMTPPDESYDYAHFEFIMRGLARAREALPELADDISLSLHCETADIMAAYTRAVEEEGRLSGLRAYDASRPPHSEGLAIAVASYLAHETDLPTINLLHLSSRKAVDSALRMARTFPHVDFRREVTIGHLTLDTESTNDVGAKVNPPIRGRDDVEALWDHVLAGDIDWVVSDHACCKDEYKFGDDRENIFLAKSGFGGTEYLLSALYTEGTKRGLPLRDIARLTSWNPAQRYGLHTKGTIEPGYDADLVLYDPSRSHVASAANSESAQEYTPFEGKKLNGQVRHVFLRGHQIVADADVVGDPAGRFLARPTRRD
jgi:allantoinase